MEHVRELGWGFFAKVAIGIKPLAVFAESSVFGF